MWLTDAGRRRRIFPIRALAGSNSRIQMNRGTTLRYAVTRDL